MKTAKVLCFVVLVLSLVAIVPVAAQEPTDEDIVFQTSTLGALLDGVYEGEMTFKTLKAHGDFGLGTFEAVDGEMVAFDGQFYQIKADGIAYPVEDDTRTPFAVVTYFTADDTLQIEEAMTCADFQTYLLSAFPSENLFYAIKITGEFAYLKTRSVPAQQQPYLPLAEVLQNQVEFEFQDIQATLAGFWMPAYIGSLNATGFHFHALTAEQAGGHVLDCEVKNVQVEIDYTAGLQLLLPDLDSFYAADLSQ